MHTDLSQHLHTDECNRIIQLFRQCRIDHSITQWVGKCNPEYDDMLRCLKNERLARRKKNFELSLERKAKINKAMREEPNIKNTSV